MGTAMKRVVQIVQVVQVRGRGRPRLDTRRIECSVPRAVYEALLREQSRSGVYHTRVAAHVLCSWAGVSAPDCRHLNTYVS